MNFIKKNFRKLSFLFLFLITPSFVIYASETCDPGKLCNPISQNTIQGFIQVFLDGALKIGIPIIALAIIYSGFLFVKARGNSKDLETAKSSLFSALIGAALLLGAWAIAKLIADTILSL